jgi:hypothetical protein
MSGMGGYGQKCEKMPKSLHLTGHVNIFLKNPFFTVLDAMSNPQKSISGDTVNTAPSYT